MPPTQAFRLLAVFILLGSLATPCRTFSVPTEFANANHGAAQPHEAGHTHTHDGHEGGSAPSGPEPAVLNPAVAARYTPVLFTNIFVTPAGPKGLEYTKSIRELQGKPVRITGFMVRHVNQDPAVFMLTEFPVSTMEHEYGIVDSVPPNVVHALLPERKDHGTAWQPYAVTVHGRLELDRRDETDGRVSYVRIRVDHITVGEQQQLVDVMRPMAERDVNLGAHRHEH